MKIITYVLGALLAVVLGAAAFYYFATALPMIEENQALKAGMPELEKAKIDLKKCKDAEQITTAWIAPVIETAKKAWGAEINAGTVELQAADARVIVNLSEQVLYLPGSVTFSPSSVPAIQKLADLLKNPSLKNREIVIGNMTLPVEARGKGKKKIPAKDALTLAFERSTALVKYLVEKCGVSQEALIAAAYPATVPDHGFKIKDQKTIISIQAPAIIPAQNPVAVQQPKPASAPTGTVAAAPKTN